jgi:NADPH-dependent curcumin reductase CurA
MNRKIVLANRPIGMASIHNFKLVEAEMPRPATRDEHPRRRGK